MDKFERDFKMLLDQELDYESVTVNDDLIKKTLLKLRQTDTDNDTTEIFSKRRTERIKRLGLVIAAGFLLFAGYRMIQTRYGLDQSENILDSEEISEIHNEEKYSETQEDNSGYNMDGGILGEIESESSTLEPAQPSDDIAVQDSTEIPNTSMGTDMADGDEAERNHEMSQTFPVPNQRYDNTNLEPISYGSFRNGSLSELYKNGWITETGTEEIVWKFSFQKLSLLYLCIADGFGGQFEVYIDGELSAVLDADASENVGDYVEEREVYSSDETREHTVSIKKAVDSTRNVFNVLSLLVSQ